MKNTVQVAAQAGRLRHERLSPVEVSRYVAYLADSLGNGKSGHDWIPQGRALVHRFRLSFVEALNRDSAAVYGTLQKTTPEDPRRACPPSHHRPKFACFA
jgi:hypothetical protein